MTIQEFRTWFESLSVGRKQQVLIVLSDLQKCGVSLETAIESVYHLCNPITGGQ